MNTVTKGACPLVVMRVTTWYWMVCTPRRISSRRRFSTMPESTSSEGVPPTAAISASTCPRIFSRETWTKGARWAREMDWPPYWLEATWAMIWVAMLQAVEKLWGFSMRVPEMTVPFWSMSSRLTRSQLCMCWA